MRIANQWRDYRLLDTSAICCLDTKEALEDTISLAGRIYGRILYLADGTDALCSLPAGTTLHDELEIHFLTSLSVDS